MNMTGPSHIYSRHIKLNVSKFEGTKSAAHGWMSQFEKACERYEIHSDREKINYLRDHLCKRAEEWYMCRLDANEPDHWESWKESFLSTFALGLFEMVKEATGCHSCTSNCVNIIQI